ncbi:MAG: HAMP domain-containing histidine kinase [Prevotella sp.]|nr:HAMP domain-containing histidine kinase [Prevotella sp.]
MALTLSGSILYATEDYKSSAEYTALRDSMSHAFNDGDSARFFPALKNLQNYLLKQKDMHAYYTQRCNEIVFLMNQQRIYEAYKCAQVMAKELREKKLDKEMYMAVNMLGHINRYCGNEKKAKECWYEALSMMEEQGYYSNMPPIYMNIVNVALDNNPAEADSLLERAKCIAEKYSKERVFDIVTRRTASYFTRGDMDKFLEGYKAYKEGEARGESSVHGRLLEVYYQCYLGNTDEAVKMAREDLGDEGLDAIVMIYEKAGRWKEAYEALKQDYATSDSIDNVVLTNSMLGIREQVRIYEMEREASNTKMITLTATMGALLLLLMALFYIVQARKRHTLELEKAYKRAMESEEMKRAFIRNISHEIRTPLNIISGFAQVIANPDLVENVSDRQHMAEVMQQNAQRMTQLIDEIIGLSLIESTKRMNQEDHTHINSLLRSLIKQHAKEVLPGIEMKFETTLSDSFTLRTNKNMLKRILNSLLDNARKYTIEGYIKLSAESDGRMLSISVEDTGSGIPAKEAEHVFERFVKLDSFKEGIGLGLPLSRKFAEQLGGTVTLDTKYTKGARFIVRLPIHT